MEMEEAPKMQEATKKKLCLLLTGLFLVIMQTAKLWHINDHFTPLSFSHLHVLHQISYFKKKKMPSTEHQLVPIFGRSSITM